MQCALRAACDQLFVHGKVDRGLFEPILLRIAAEEARVYYEVFVAMVVLAPQEFVRFCQERDVSLAWLPNANHDVLNRFHSCFMEVGDLVDKLADCIEFSPASRQRKWTGEQQVRETLRADHARSARVHSTKSAFLLASRIRNRRAHRKVKRSIKVAREEWQIVVVSETNALIGMSRGFWNCLRVDRLSSDQKRAVLYSLEHLKRISYLEKSVEALRRDLEDQLFAADRPTERGRCKQASYLCCRRQCRSTSP